MTLEELANLLRTPLPGPPQLTPEQLLRLRAVTEATRGRLEALLPSLPAQLPLAPDWMLRYSAERGLLPGQGAVGVPPTTSALRRYPATTPYGAPVAE